MSGYVKPSLTLKRHIKATPEKVYRAWTQPEGIKRWFGPGAVKVTLAETDVRVGGRFRIVLLEADGEEHRVGGTYQDVVENELLAFDWAWESTPERLSQVTVKLAANGSGTDLTLLHEQFFDDKARNSHEHGWLGSLDKLEAVFADA